MLESKTTRRHALPAPAIELVCADQLPLTHFDAGQRRSISAISCSAHRMASLIALIVAGTRAPPSYCANFRAARIAAAISRTRLRPSSILDNIACSPFVRCDGLRYDDSL
jgi:hypothetical protein